MNRIKLRFLLGILLFNIPIFAQSKSSVSKYNVTWTTPSKFAHDNMPLGNGKMGVTVSATADGVLHLIPVHVDAWSEAMQILKLGILNVKILPNPFLSDFSQTLDIEKGIITIKGSNNFIAEMRVDANRSVFVFEAQSDKDFTLETEAEIWRTQDKQIKSSITLDGMPNGIFESADIQKTEEPKSLLWYHRNKPNHHYSETLKLHEVDSLFSTSKDILENLTFGAFVTGIGMSKTGERTLISSAGKKQSFRIDVLCKRTQTATQWEDEIRKNATVKLSSKDKKNHLVYWEKFWNTSWINVMGDAQAETASNGYAHVMYLNALAGKGEFPIMWNGSIFSPDPRNYSTHYHGGTIRPNKDIDFHNWGNCMLNQNLRLPFYSMPSAGQCSFAKPYIDMYMRGLPLMREHTRKVFGHDGTFFREGMTLWGISAPGIYGFDRTDLPRGEQSSEWHRTHWQGGLETAFFMGECYEYTLDEGFAKNSYIPFANEVVKFFDLHWPHKNGKLFFPHTYVLETFRDVDNPMPFVAGLHAVLKQLLALPTNITTKEQRNYWTELQTRLPEIPLRNYKGMTILANADTVRGNKENVETGELYAVFPYHQFGVGLPNLEIAQNTWHNNTVKVTDVGGENPGWSKGYLRGGWRQEVVMAAMAGMTEEAKEEVSWGLGRTAENMRYPGYFQTSYDWIPDVQHGSMHATALQRMLLQEVDGKIILLPAWPKAWNADFKLYAKKNTVIEGRIENGKMLYLNVTPKERKKDVVIYEVNSL